MRKQQMGRAIRCIDGGGIMIMIGGGLGEERMEAKAKKNSKANREISKIQTSVKPKREEEGKANGGVVRRLEGGGFWM